MTCALPIYWISENKIIDERVTNFANTPTFSLIETKNFQLIATLERLQISIKGDKITPENAKELPEIIMRYIKKLPETPYKSLGINFSYEIEENSGKLKSIFCPHCDKFKEIFTEKYDIGGQIKFEADGYKVTLNIVPTESVPRADFNFDSTVKGKEEIINKIGDYPKLLDKSEEILGRLFE